MSAAEQPGSPASARVVSLWREGARATGLRLEVDAPWRAAHRRPGQYVLVGPTGALAGGQTVVPLAIASAPGRPVELLLGDEARDLVRPRVGDTLPLSAPAGAGFVLDDARGQELLVFAIGTAASAARALVDGVVAERAAYGRVRLYLGAHTLEEHFYRGDDARWTEAGVEVVRAVSKPWIQALFLAGDHPATGARAFAVGHAGLVAGVREAIAARGLDPASLGLNV